MTVNASKCLARTTKFTQPIRLALVAMLTFLEANGNRIDAADPELAEWIIGLSVGLTPEQLAERIRPLLIPATAR